MQFQVKENRVTDLKVAYLGGGSRGWAWGFMKDLAMDGQMEGTVVLYDINRQAAEANKIIGNKISAHPDAKARWSYRVADSLEEALTGADFVVISILPGTFQEMRSDVHEPEQFGIYQSVGDTVGPGGLIRAMRTLPIFAEFARGIAAYCPQAWVINYTNPMTVCVRTLYQVFPKIKAFGCCHEVFGVQETMAAMLNDLRGIQGVRREEIRTNVLGINHFTWIDKASYKGLDLMPIWKEFCEKYAEEGFIENPSENWMNSHFESCQRVKIDLTKRYGIIAAAGDRHLAEFMPPWYLKTPETVKYWKFSLTSVDWREKDLQERLERSRRLVSGGEVIELSPSGEEGHLLMKALLGLGDMVSNVNIPNRGQMPDLPADVVVETNALFRRDEISPVCAGHLPGNVLALIERHVCNQENTVKAALSCDKELAFTTFMNDPQVNLTIDDGRELFERMLHNTEKYLPDSWKC